VFEDHSEEVKKSVHSQLEKGLTYIGENGVNIAKTLLDANDTGGLRSSITKEVELSGDGGAVRVGTEKEYAPYVEGGSAPHKTSAKSADFIENITAWCARHGIKDVYLVIRYIRRYGTSAHPFLRPSFDEMSKKADDILTRYLAEVGG
jgi:hypothetical protein